MTTAGVVTNYALSSPNGTGQLVVGPDHALWFTENTNKIGRIDTTGNLSEYPVANAGSPLVSGSDGNLWFTAGTSAYAFSPTTHTIVGTTSGLPTGTSIYQLVSNPATGDIMIQAYDSIGAGFIYRFAPGAAPTPSQVYAGPMMVESLMTGGSNIYAISAGSTQSILVFSQSSYAQAASIALPQSFELHGSTIQGSYTGPLLATSSDFFMGSGCDANRCGGGFYDMAQVTSAGAVSGQGPRNNHPVAVGESFAIGGGAIGSDGNVWTLYEDGMALHADVERVTPTTP
jgi:hypothetical protein